MNLSDVDKECNAVFIDKWFDVGASRLKLSFAPHCCEELKLAKKIKTSMSTDDLAFLISTKVLTDWSGLKDPKGNDVPYSQLNAFNALANDLNFLNLVSELCFERSNFV